MDDFDDFQIDEVASCDFADYDFDDLFDEDENERNFYRSMNSYYDF